MMDNRKTYILAVHLAIAILTLAVYILLMWGDYVNLFPILTQEESSLLNTDKSEVFQLANRYLNSAIQFFHAFSVWALLALSKKVNDIIEEHPEIYQERVIDWSLFLIATGIFVWMLAALITRQVNSENIIFTEAFVACFSLINSALLLNATVYLDYDKKPVWVSNRVLNQLFQTSKGIWLLCLAALVITLWITCYLSNNNLKDSKHLEWILIPDLLFVIPTSFYFFAGMFKLFKERGGGVTILLWGLPLLLTVSYHVCDTFPSLIQDAFLAKNYYMTLFGTAYRTSLIALIMVLSFTWIARLRTQVRDHVMAQLKLANEKLDSQTKELKKKNKELDNLRSEVHHRMSNHLQMLANSIENQAVGVEDQNIKLALTRSLLLVESIGKIHELLDIHTDEKVPLKNYFSELLLRCKDSYAFADCRIEYQLTGLDASLKLKESSARQLGMLIVEACFNITEHAYAPGETKKAVIKAFNNDETLTLSIQDFGKGITNGYSTAIKKGKGLRIIEAIVGQLSGSWQPVSSPNEGTLIHTTFTINNLK